LANKDMILAERLAKSNCTTFSFLSENNSFVLTDKQQQKALYNLVFNETINLIVVDEGWCTTKEEENELVAFCQSTGAQLLYWSVGDKASKSRLFNPFPLPFQLGCNVFAKRTFDLIFSLGVIILIMPWFIPIVYLLIRLDSKGPAFFSQRRTGYNNRTFYCFKFRSMVVNKYSDALQASESDERITRIGRLLRKTNLDEFPQFFNVLIGNMSVVGPRPHMLKHTQEYSVIENYMMRHLMKPGVTGLSQARGLHGETDQLWKMERRLRTDLEYIRNWSFWLDIKIIFWTITKKHKDFSMN